ncbi:helix-turn-helix domain-containing protein [Kitasatospora sp. NPDC101447]|uniref:helix-turn-helix domain-containing protein n=1 Tax=Kitasatospora sp. NPDC101447 TaxID=3364102 RepID=UPI00380D194B
MQIEHAMPSQPLRPFVERYWWCTAEVGRLPRLLPGTGAELWIRRAAGGELQRLDGSLSLPLPSAHLVCLRRSSWNLVAREPVGLVAVRFRAGALRHFMAPGVGEIVDSVLSTEDLWGAAGRRLVERVSVSSDASNLAGLLDRFLLARLAAHHRAATAVDAAVAMVYRSPAQLRMASLAQRLSVSPRWLQRAFPAAVGAGPKEFQRLARFQQVTKALMRSDQQRYLPAALAAGYYDQNHFIREFRQFTAARPSELLGRGLTHFYYDSLLALGQAGVSNAEREVER